MTQFIGKALALGKRFIIGGAYVLAGFGVGEGMTLAVADDAPPAIATGAADAGAAPAMHATSAGVCR